MFEPKLTPPTIQLVVFDWAGTTVDWGSFAPVAAFIDSFLQEKIEISAIEARSPMGLHKKDHIRTILQGSRVSELWKKTHARDWSEADVQRIFESFMPRQMEALARHSELIPGLLETVAELRSRGIRIAGTTGYFRAAADRVAELARKQGYSPDVNHCPEDVSAGRPYPWMIFRSMEKLGVYPPCRVLKVGDTIPDIQEGLNAGVWSYGVVETSSETGYTRSEWESLSEETRQQASEITDSLFRAAGAHGAIPTIFDVPQLIDTLNAKLANGERP